MQYLSIYPIVLGTVGAPHDLAANIRHSSRSSALLTVWLSSKPVQSRMLSSHHFLCLPLLLPPRTVPWRTVLCNIGNYIKQLTLTNVSAASSYRCLLVVWMSRLLMVSSILKVKVNQPLNVSDVSSMNGLVPRTDILAVEALFAVATLESGSCMLL